MSANSQPVSHPPLELAYRFGNFELNATSGELHRNGTKVRLQAQPFLVLRKLLESAGSIVSREDLHSALWPADTFVDFDTSLNTAIKRLREVLGDSADTPVFIETVPRRGYRFLAPVQVIHNGAPATPRARASSRARVMHFRLRVLVSCMLVAAVGGGLTVALRSPTSVPRILDSTQMTFDRMAKGNLRLRGGKIYFNEQRPPSDRVTLVQIPEVGGTPASLASELYLGDVSPDGSKLIVTSPGSSGKGPYRLTIMDLASGSIQNLDSMECDDVTWAPTGRLLISKGGDLFVAEPDGSKSRKLLSVPGRIYWVRFSPDGARLRFSVANISAVAVSDVSIWEARADGSGAHEILTEMSDYPDRCCGEWSPDGRYYYFRTTRNGGSRIWALAERHPFWTKTPAPVPLTTVPPNFYMGPPSEDGKKLFVTAAEPRAELVRFDARSHEFVPFLSGLSAGDVEASRDGRMLTYVRYPELTLWRSKTDGADAAQLTGPSLRATLPHWSPDGKQIAFSGSRPGRPWNLFLISASGGPAEQLTSGPISDLDATWSPDGSTLAYGMTRLDGGKQIVSIQILDLATRRSAPLVGSDGICCPRWSPDGRFILASHANYDDLLLYEFASRKWTLIAKGLGMIGYMEWTESGKDILFDTLVVPDPAFYRLHLSNLHVETVVKIGDIPRYFGPFGPWTGVSPDGSPLLVRDISNEEIYCLDLKLP
jgi:Tol biopolymer transport system component/DNA-binding winged helix-turn-helix (wHTH) protein